MFHDKFTNANIRNRNSIKKKEQHVAGPIIFVLFIHIIII